MWLHDTQQEFKIKEEEELPGHILTASYFFSGAKIDISQVS